MLYRQLGNTGEVVSIVGLGGHHIGLVEDDDEAVQIIRDAIDAGITFMDNSWDYHLGRSELLMGRALTGGYREKVFLMTKVDGRTRESAAAQMAECFERLQTDVIDLMQIHEVIRVEDADLVFAPGGALEVLIEAREAGRVRYIGFTGHKDPFLHLRMLDLAEQHDFRFNAVQMPLNVMDAHFRSFEREVLPRLVAEEIAVIGMKSMGAGDVLESGIVSAEECLRYALSLPVSTLVTGIDSRQVLEQDVALGASFIPLSAAERTGLLERTAEPARSGRFERYKTTRTYDATAGSPEWLGTQ